MIARHAGRVRCRLLRREGRALREPRKPSEPELFQLNVLPTGSVMVTMVLLNVACTYAMPNGTFCARAS